MRRRLLGQVLQDAVHLAVHRQVRFLDLVVQVHQLARLDEHRCPAGGHVVHDPGNFALPLDLDRQDVAVLTLREVLLLQQAGVPR